jgi:electron transfer flavoprotein alpha subunit
MTKDILVFVECKDGSVRKASLELLSLGRKLAAALSSRMHAVLLGADVKGAAEELQVYADSIIIAEDGQFGDYRNDVYTGALEYFAKRIEPLLIIGAATVTGKDLFPRLAARLDCGFVSEAVGIAVDGSSITVKKPIFGGKMLSLVEVKEGTAAIITFRPNSFAVERKEPGAEVAKETAPISMNEALKVVRLEKVAARKVDLQEADFIICGGRGMKEAGAFGMLEEIATTMGGRVGASRAVVDTKWREYDDQIGKSGKTVSPKLYIGCGVSGALHHIMGMDTSKVIVAINRDVNAPIFQYADYGIVDDLFAVLPALSAELKRVKETG